MVEINESNAAAYALERGWFPPHASLDVEWLAGGVSNIVLRISRPGHGFDIVLKQARERLRVQADWRSRLDRVWREVLAIHTIARIAPSGTVPDILDEDRDNFAFAMTAASREHAVFKQELLAGSLADGLLARLGAFLGGIHACTRDPGVLPAELHDREVFDELRLDPYYRWTAARRPAWRSALEDLIADTLAHPVCLTLADFSPKNILLFDDSFLVIDFETAHLGDPAFDLGFFLTHLVLKSLHVPPLRPALLAGADEFWSTYADAGGGREAIADVEARAMRHLAACLIARVDGKSPVDYLSSDEQQTVRAIAGPLLLEPVDRWSAFVAAWQSAFRGADGRG
ncbi:MAG: phosphotransferase [Planctomyces sp.]|nr:phosphotransferase [Planctomyces sp.]